MTVRRMDSCPRRAVVAGLAVLGLSPRRGAAQARRPASRGGVSFRLLQDSAILFSAEVGGAPANVLIDTGAAATLVSLRRAAALGWPAGDPRPLRDNSARAIAQAGRELTLDIGSYPLTVPQAVVLDLDLVSSTMGIPVDIVLGRALFESAVVAIDFPARRLEIGEDLWDRRGNGRTVAVGRGAHGERTVPLSLEGRDVIPAVLDLGDASPLMLSARYAEGNGLLAGKRLSSAAIAMVGGVETSTSVVLHTVEFAGVRFLDVPAEALPQWLEPEIPGNLGLPVLSRFRLVCDFGHDRLHVAPAPDAARRPFDKDRSGLGLAVKSDRLVVVHVAPGGAGARAGLQRNDEIVAVSGRPITPDYPASAAWRWRLGAAGTRVRLRLASGKSPVVVLADDY